MKVAIVGVGAVGGLLGARLAAKDHEISALARNATLDALKTTGLQLETSAGAQSYRVRASASALELGQQDLVIVAVKGPALKRIAPETSALIGPHTQVLIAMNGVPWWFFDGLPGELDGTVLRSVDPDGTLRHAIPTRQVIGSVVHLTASCPQPGTCRHGFGNGLIIGEPAGGESPRIRQMADVLAEAGFDVMVSRRIQQDIWYKLWGNMTMNPISALTGATCDQILDDPLVSDLCTAVMNEAAAVGARIGCPVAQRPEDRNAITRSLGAFKTSMLQDVEHGKPLEIDSLLSVVLEIAQRVAVPVPHTSALLGLTRLMARTRGLAA